jgi:hypothetical protein
MSSKNEVHSEISALADDPIVIAIAASLLYGAAFGLGYWIGLLEKTSG